MTHPSRATTKVDRPAAPDGDAKFRLMFERSADAILLLDTHSNNFVEYNQAALDMLRCTREELSALHPSMLSPPRQADGRDSYEKANEMIATAVRQGSNRFEWTHRSPHREDFPVEVLLTPIQLGRQPMVVVVWRDITERRRAEAAMRQAQKLESLGVLAGGIAHDFNNLLAAIQGHLELARADVSADGDAATHLHQIQQAVRKAAELTRQMLAYGGRGRFHVEPVDLCRAVRELSALLGVSVPKRVRMVTQLPGGLPAFEADRAQVHQVIMNLVTNAAEAIGDAEGTITLRAGAATLDEEALHRDHPGQDLSPGPYVSLEVQDTGVGIPPDVLPRIFDPFYTTKQSGRGLGLSALQGIMKGHKGGIRIHSEPGRGTTFHVLFPASGALPAPERPPAPAPGLTHQAAGTVLLVDDDVGCRNATRSMLELLGFTVVEAADGVAAVHVFEAQRQRIRWVLMDLTMPRMDGHTAFQALRRLQPDVRVVLCSGWAEEDLEVRFRETPPLAFLAKPYTLEDLESLLEKHALAAR